MAILGLQGVRGELASRPLRLHSPGPCNCSVKACWRSTPARIICCAFSLIPISIIRTAGRGRCSTAGTGVTRACAIRSISICCRLASSAPAKENVDQLQPTLGAIAEAVQQLQGQYRWLLLDLPAGYSPLTRELLTLCDRSLVVVHPDANSHIRLHQQPLPANGDILINDLRVGSQLQEDLYQLWLESQPRILSVTIHRDEAMAECLAAKQPLGEYRQDSLAAEEVLTLANWCLIHYSAGRAA